MLLTTKQLRSIQEIGESGMNTTALVYSRSAQGKDPSNPYGDDDVLYGSPVTVKGWLVTKPTQRIDPAQGQVQAIATHQLRVPVGTAILTGDKVAIGSEEFTVVDATNEQSWPEWTVAYLRGYQP